MAEPNKAVHPQSQPGPTPDDNQDHDDALVERVAKVIRDEGGAAGNSLHSWRCEYPDRYGPCNCVDEVARSVLDAIAVPQGDLAYGGPPVFHPDEVTAPSTVKVTLKIDGGPVTISGSSVAMTLMDGHTYMFRVPHGFEPVVTIHTGDAGIREASQRGFMPEKPDHPVAQNDDEEWEHVT